MGPASPAQEEVWLSCALEHEAPLFAVTIRLRLRGRLNIHLLEQAVSRIVARHETLRTTYQPGTEGLLQQVDEPALVCIALCDLEGLDTASRDTIETSVYRQEAAVPFDLGRGPMLRVRLIKRAGGEFTVLFTVHHIALDGWSMGVFTKDLQKIHAAYGRGELPKLTGLTLRYIDFAQRQREQVGTFLAQAGIEALRERFRLPPLVLKLEKPGESRSTRGDHVQLPLTLPLLQRMTEFGRQEKATQFIVLTAVLWIVLYAHSGASRFVMASDYANRTEPDSDGVMGLFVSQLLLQARMRGQASFRDVVALARDEMQQALRRVPCPTSALAPFRVKLAFQPGVDYPELLDLTVTGAEVLSECAKFDLLFSVQMSRGAAWVDLQYRRGMFERRDMITLMEDLESLAHRCLEQPERSVDSLVGELLERRLSASKVQLDTLKQELLGAVAPAREATARGVQLTEISRLEVPAGRLSPVVVRARVRGMSLKHWVATNRAVIETSLSAHGAILLRDFHVDPAEFQDIATELMGELMSYVEGATPREKKSPKTYSATLFPQDAHIELHNELSSAMTFPRRIAFHCVKPAASGGETPLADVHQVYTHVPRRIREDFSARGWMLVRNFHKGFGLTWQQAFETEDRDVVAEYCLGNDIEYAWERDGNLRLRQVRSAVLVHPDSGLPVWFNHIAFWHESRLESDMRAMLLKEYGREGLPFNTYYGDGAAIDTETIDAIHRAYHEAYTSFPWRRHDLLCLDNIGVAHGRSPYTGQRDVRVSMGQPYRRERMPG